MGAIPTGSDQLWEFLCADSPIDPCEDHATDEKEQQSAGQQVFHAVENSCLPVI